MQTPLRLLWVDQVDVQRLIDELRAQLSSAFTVEIISTPEALKSALNQQVWHLLLVGNSSFDVQPILHTYKLYPPVILLSETLDPAWANERGVVDYVSPHDVKRLAFILKREAGTERLFRSVIEQLDDGVVLMNLEGRVIYSNQNGQRILGYDPGEMLGLNIFEITHPEDRPQSEALFREIMKSPGASATMEGRARCKDGSWHWIEAIGTNLLDNPSVQAILINYYDVTQRHHAAEALVKRQRELEILLEISRDLSSVLDLNEILSFIAQRAVALLNADECVLFHLEDDGKTLRPILVIGMYVEQRMAAALQVGRGVVGWSVAHNQPVLSNNIQNDPRAIHIAGTPDEEVEHVMIAPLMVRGAATGAMLVNRLEKDEFTEADLSIFVGLAQHISIAIDNARLFKAEREQRVLAEALRDTISAIGGTLDFDAVLDRILSNIEKVIPHDAASIMLAEKGELRVVKQRGFAERGDDQIVSKLVFPIVKGSDFEQMLISRRPVLKADTHTDPYWIEVPEINWIRSNIGVPLFRGDRLLGLLNIDSSIPNFFTQKHVDQLTYFVSQAAIALENASLYRELERYSQSLEDAVEARTNELRQIKERVEVILSSNPEAILLLDPNGVIETVNPAFCDLFLCPEDHIQGHSLLELIPPDSVESLNNTLASVKERGEKVRLEIMARRQNGGLFDAAIAIAPVWESGSLTGLVCTLRDISSLKEVQRMKDTFVANISHELRTPISSLRLYHHLLAHKPDKVPTYLTQLERETDRLQRIIENVLLLSRLDQNRTPIKPALLDLNALAEQFVTDRALLAESRKLTLKFNGQPDLPPVMADGGMLGLALSIILTNALNYTPEEGCITVTTAMRLFNNMKWVELRVSDNGVGIPLAEQPHLFERFFRGTIAIESGLPGTGLGLSIAKEIMDRHEGRIMMESSGVPGQGAAFGLWLRVPESFQNVGAEES